MRVSFWAILAATAGLLMALVAMRPLLPIDETRYLSVAWEMWQSHDPLHLTKNGELYTHKTPLLFAMINLVWFVTGVTNLPRAWWGLPARSRWWRARGCLRGGCGRKIPRCRRGRCWR